MRNLIIIFSVWFMVVSCTPPAPETSAFDDGVAKFENNICCRCRRCGAQDSATDGCVCFTKTVETSSNLSGYSCCAVQHSIMFPRICDIGYYDMFKPSHQCLVRLDNYFVIPLTCSSNYYQIQTQSFTAHRFIC